MGGSCMYVLVSVGVVWWGVCLCVCVCVACGGGGDACTVDCSGAVVNGYLCLRCQSVSIFFCEKSMVCWVGGCWCVLCLRAPIL